MNYITYILMAAPEGGGEQKPLGMLLPMVAIFVIFWLFMIRPQAKKQKELRQFRETLQKGDKIVTSGGIYGKVTSMKDNQIVIQVDENVKLTVDKSSVLKDATDLNQQRK
jgi:preprotein translocase subunit YajC